MDTILRGTAATISATLYVDATATDPTPDSATVKILKDSGATLVDTTAATNAANGRFTFTLSPAQTADLDILTAQWTATIGGVAQTVETQVEIVGGYLISLSQIDATVDATKTADELSKARNWAETALEDACGRAFRPRYGHDVLSGDASTTLVLNRAATSIEAVSVDDTALTETELGDVEVSVAGIAYRAAGWSLGHQNVDVIYTYGQRYCPPRVAGAALRLARHYLLTDPSDLDERATSITTEDATYALVTAGVRGASFSIPEVNQVVAEYGRAGVGVG